MVSKGGGGGAGPAIEYGNKSLALQKQIYDEGKGYAQPYYNAGTSGLNELMSRLGLSTAGSPTNRQNLIDQYKGQFTTTNKTQSQGNPYGIKYTYDQYGNPNQIEGFGQSYNTDKFGVPINNIQDAYGSKNARALFDRMQAGGGVSRQVDSSVTDNAGLNSFVDNLIAQQTQKDQNNPLYGSLLQNYSGQDIYNDPSYKFRFAEGQKATERALAASKKFLSPAGFKALQGYGQDMASQEYGNAYNRFTNDQTNIYNRLANIAGLGQTAAGQIAGIGNNYANQGTETFSGISNSIIGAQQARATDRSSMFNTLLGAGGQIGAAYLMSDERLKENIVPYGEENGHNIYKFNYKTDPEKTYLGVMAQEVLDKDPEAVTVLSNGHYAVNYDKIGVKFKEVTSCH